MECGCLKPIYKKSLHENIIVNHTRLRELNNRINYIKHLNPNSPELWQSEEEELNKIKREDEESDIKFRIPLYASPIDKSKLICSDCHEIEFKQKYQKI